VDADSIKYFSFSTPDGQYEYKKLPFGFSEAPAEFQKRLNQILNPLIREDKVLVYMDDVFIPSQTVKQNLTILKEVLITLKRYKFELNYEKCQFLRKTIEFLRYIVSEKGITLSARHTETVREFRQPRNVLEVQRFLELAGYFRKFIKNFTEKARPLQNLVKKNVAFILYDKYRESFQLLKRELISSLILALYNPAADTELHTDASSSGLGAVLLQKQPNGLCAVVAY